MQVLALSQRSSLVIALTMLVPEWDVDAVPDADGVRGFGTFDVLVVESPTTAEALATTAALRADGIAAPIVVVGDVVPGDEGPESVLTRPFTVAELRDRIAELLGIPTAPEPEPVPAPDEGERFSERLRARFRWHADDEPAEEDAPRHAPPRPDLLQVIGRLSDVASPPPTPAEAPVEASAEAPADAVVEEPPASLPEEPAATTEPAASAQPAVELPKLPRRVRRTPPPPRHHIDPHILELGDRPDPTLFVDADGELADDEVPDVVEVLGGYERTDPVEVDPTPESLVPDATTSEDALDVAPDEPAPAPPPDLVVVPDLPVDQQPEAEAAPTEATDRAGAPADTELTVDLDEDVVVLPDAEPEPFDTLEGAERELRAMMAELVNAFDPVTASIWVQDDEERWHVVEHLGLRPAESRRVVSPEQPMFAALSANLHGVLLSPADLARGYLAGVPGTWAEDVIAAAIGFRGRCLAIVVVGASDLTPRSTRRLVALTEAAGARLAPYDPPPRRRRLLPLGRR